MDTKKEVSLYIVIDIFLRVKYVFDPSSFSEI